MVRGRESLLRLAATTLGAASLVLPALGCGGDDGADERRAKDHYQAYRAAEDARTAAEGRLRKAVRDIARGAGERDRGSVFSAATRGQIAAAEIHRLLDRELDAASGLAAYERTRADGRRLEQGLQTTRQGLRFVERELAIALVDPFLDLAENERAISGFAKRVVELSSEGELAIRRADRAIALELGLEPRFDPMFDPLGRGEAG